MDEEVLDACLSFVKELDSLIAFAEAVSAWSSVSGCPEPTHEADSFCAFLDIYQLQPTLLDPHLAALTSPLVASIRAQCRAVSLTNPIPFRCIYHLCKVCGIKAVTRVLPNQAADVEPAISLLWAATHTQQSDATAVHWEVHFSLLAWLSILVLVPFDFATLDSGLALPGPAIATLASRLHHLCVLHAQPATRVHDAAVLCLARLLARPDLRAVALPAAVGACCRLLLAEGDTAENGWSNRDSALSFLFTLFSVAQRDVLLPVTSLFDTEAIFRRYIDPDVCASAKTRTLATQFATALSETFLPPRKPSWVYNRGVRSLTASLGSGAATGSFEVGSHAPLAHYGGLSCPQTRARQAVKAAQATSAAVPDAGDAPDAPISEEEWEEAFDVPTAFDHCVDALLGGLRDSDTVVRNAASSGIGRVTARLPHDFGDEVVGAVLEMFDPAELDSSWHGACLAVAELARRGLLLPARLPFVVPLVQTALTYDVRRGAHSVGRHVRDAACFVVWAFARAYDPSVISPYVLDLGRSVLATALFDREGVCRRAAAASFQELVGRLGLLPHGIDIVTAADFFSVGLPRPAFTTVAWEVGRHPEYAGALVTHLCAHTLASWDIAVRRLAAESLGGFARLFPSMLAGPQCIGLLLPMTSDSDAFAAHGAMVAAGTVLSELAAFEPVVVTGLDCPAEAAEAATAIGHVVSDCICRHVADKSVSERARDGLCALIGGAATFITRFASAAIQDGFAAASTSFVLSCLDYPSEAVQTAAAAAIGSLAASLAPSHPQRARAATELLAAVDLQSNAPVLRRQGYALGLAALASSGRLFAVEDGVDVITVLSIAAANVATGAADVYARANACTALGAAALHFVAVARTLPASDSEQRDYLITLAARAAEALLPGLADYASDAHGDVGQFVRSACLRAGKDLLASPLFLATACPVTASLAGSATLFLHACVRLSLERMAPVRELARSAASAVLAAAQEAGLDLPGAPALAAGFAPSDSDWPIGQHLAAFLPEPTVLSPALAGLVHAVGSKTPTITRAASHELVQLLITDDSLIGRLADELVALIEASVALADYRTLEPALMTAERLLLEQLWPFDADFDADEPEQCPGGRLLLAVRAAIRTTSVPILLSCACAALAFLQDSVAPVTRRLALAVGALLLGRKLPRLREHVVGLLLEGVLDPTDDGSGFEAEAAARELLESFSWKTESLAAVREARNRLCEILGLETPSSAKGS
jgi:hypothetical protein